MNRPPLEEQTRRLALLIAPVVRTAARDQKTRQRAYEAVSTLTGRPGRDIVGRLGAFSQPATEWLDTVRRGERRRRLRTLAGRIGLVAVAGGLLASRLLKRPNHQSSHDHGVAPPVSRSSASSEASNPIH